MSDPDVSDQVCPVCYHPHPYTDEPCVSCGCEEAIKEPKRCQRCGGDSLVHNCEWNGVEFTAVLCDVCCGIDEEGLRRQARLTRDA